MPTNRVKRTRTQQGLDYWKIDQLIVGWPMLAGVGYSEGIWDGCNHWKDGQWQEFYGRMKADWDEIGADFMAWWRGETERFTAAYASIGGDRRDPSITPWALTEFGEPK